MTARFFSGTGLGSGNLIGGAQFLSVPALDRIWSPKNVPESTPESQKIGLPQEHLENPDNGGERPFSFRYPQICLSPIS